MSQKKNSINKVIRVPVEGGKKFFHSWVEILSLVNNFQQGERRLLEAFLQERYELSKHISDDAMLDELLFSSSRKQNIRSALDMSQLYFQGLMTSLRKKQVIIEGRLNPKFIPKGLKDGSSFGLLFEFDFDGNCTSKGI